MKHSDSIANLAASLVAAQAEMKAIGKDSTNPHFKSKFASLDTIIDTVRPVLSKQGLTLVQGAANPITDEAGALCGFAVETMLIHKSGEWLRNDAVMPLAKVDPQGAGSALTYGRRYGLSALLCLSTEDDDDGNQASRPSQQSSSGTASRPSGGATPHTGNGGASKAAAEKVWPFGDKKGTPLGAFESPELEKMLKWCREKKKDDISAAIQEVLNDRVLGVPSPNEMHPALRNDGDDLPF